MYAMGGLMGGLVREIVSHKGVIVLPRREPETGNVNLGFLSALIIGAVCGVLAPWAIGVNAAFSVLGGYVGQDFIENLVERKVKPGRGSNPRVMRDLVLRAPWRREKAEP